MNQQLDTQKKKKIKTGNEEFIVERFNNEESENNRSREIVLRNEDKNNPKVLKQKIFAQQTENSKHAGAYREVSEAKKFKNGFAFKSSKVFVSKSIFGGKRQNE